MANDIKNYQTLSTFKIKLMWFFNCKALLFNHDIDRNIQVAFGQITICFSNLNFDLYSNECVIFLSE